MAKQSERISKVESWYPTSTDIVQTQREQILKSRQEAAAFASQKFGKLTSSWWKRVLRIR